MRRRLLRLSATRAAPCSLAMVLGHVSRALDAHPGDVLQEAHHGTPRITVAIPARTRSGSTGRPMPIGGWIAIILSVMQLPCSTRDGRSGRFACLPRPGQEPGRGFQGRVVPHQAVRVGERIPVLSVITVVMTQ